MTKLTTFDLSDNQLTTLPESIGQLTNLANLDLRNNQLTTLPESIDQLTKLTTLDLSDNQLTTLPESIGHLTNLTKLDLSDNQLTTLPEWVSQLTKLTTLGLRNNQLTTLPESIGQLTKLTTLGLRNNQLTTLPESIGQLTKLTTPDYLYNPLIMLPESIGRQFANLTVLDLHDHQLTMLPESIGQLTKLTSLILYNNRLTMLPETIGQLTNLTWLYLQGNKLTTLPESVGQLTNLTWLNLQDNKLTTLPESIGQLTNLTKLNLQDNQLTMLPESIGQLTNLTELHLYGNNLTTLPETVCYLINLTWLDLRNKGLTTLPEWVSQLTNLTDLDLRNNDLITLPESISQLVNLTRLDLQGNKLTKLPESIGQLTNLISLDLQNHQLSTLPETIGQLTNLTRLDLRDNQLIMLPESIGRLTNLTELVLYDNQLAMLPESIGQLTNLTKLYLGGNQLITLPETICQLTNLNELVLSNNNHLEIPPPEIVQGGLKAIKAYFQQLEREGVDYLYEAKLLIVGEAGAGKTSLARKIKKPDYELQPDEKSTEGIDIIPWEFPLSEERDFRVNIWDFGGQEIYHATHQFFLTKRSMYALVADTRKEDTDFYYWLNVVELLSDNSPLLIVKNEKQDRRREINERQLRGQFTNLEKTLATNLATNRGLDEILTQVKHYISGLPHVGDKLPKTWLKVRRALENDTRNYISLDEYLDICQKNGFKTLEHKLQLSSYLHDLGVCLHFQDDPVLKNTVILKPTWGTDAVYRVLDNKRVINNLGRFTRRDLADIWNEDKYLPKHDELLQLMMKFQLCYPLPSSKDTYIAPQLLSENQPKYPWPKTNNLILRYTYEFMPKGIITRFIVVMHALMAGQDYVWKNGIILKKPQTAAEIIENYGKREMTIRVAGSHRKDLLIIVTHELDKIHADYRRLKYSKLIPCNCQTCKNRREPHFYEFESLRRRIDNQIYEVECDVSYDKVDVLGLIDDVGARRLISSREDDRRFAPDVVSDQEHLRRMITTYHRRLQVLQEQQARLGMTPPPSMVIEIEEIEAKIARLETELENSK